MVLSVNTLSSFTTSIFSFSLFVSTDSPTKAPCPRLTPARCLRGWIWTINRGLSLGCRHRRKWRCYLTSEIIHKVGLLLRLSCRLRPPAGGRRHQRQHALQQRHLWTVFIFIYRYSFPIYSRTPILSAGAALLLLCKQYNDNWQPHYPLAPSQQPPTAHCWPTCFLHFIIYWHFIALYLVRWWWFCGQYWLY